MDHILNLNAKPSDVRYASLDTDCNSTDHIQWSVTDFAVQIATLNKDTNLQGINKTSCSMSHLNPLIVKQVPNIPLIVHSKCLWLWGTLYVHDFPMWPPLTISQALDNPPPFDTRYDCQGCGKRIFDDNQRYYHRSDCPISRMLRESTDNVCPFCAKSFLYLDKRRREAHGIECYGLKRVKRWIRLCGPMLRDSSGRDLVQGLGITKEDIDKFAFPDQRPEVEGINYTPVVKR